MNLSSKTHTSEDISNKILDFLRGEHLSYSGAITGKIIADAYNVVFPAFNSLLESVQCEHHLAANKLLHDHDKAWRAGRAGFWNFGQMIEYGIAEKRITKTDQGWLVS